MTYRALADAVAAEALPTDLGSMRELARLADVVRRRMVEALGALDAVEAWDLEGATSMQAWLRANGRCTGQEAGRLSKLARRCRQLPVTFGAWESDSLTGGQVEAVVQNLADRTVELFAQREAEYVPFVAPLDQRATVAWAQSWRQHAEAVVDGDGDGELHRELHASRTIGGRGVLSGDLDPAGMAVVERALDAAGTYDGKEETRSPARRRADAFVEICEQYLATRGAPAGRRRPHVEIHIQVDDLATGHGARTIDGLLLDPTTVKQWLCDCSVARVLRDRRGVVLDYGRDTHAVSHGLFRAVRARDKHCRWPGCDRPAHWTEAHHVWAWEDGGPTRLDNLVLLCSRHHHRLHRPGHHGKLLPDGTLEITFPDGTTRTTTLPPPQPAPRDATARRE